MVKFFMRNFILIPLFSVILLGCRHHPIPVVPPSPPPETFEQFLLRTELVRINDLTSHDPSNPTPDYKLIYEAFVRGRVRVAAYDPKAADIQMYQLSFFQPRLEMSPSGKPYPVIAGADVRGRSFFSRIEYSYEQVVEHETVHALLWILGHDIYPIGCHGTPDDPFGVPENVSSCIEKRSGTTY